MTSIAPVPMRVLVAGATAAPDGGTPAALVHTLVTHLRRRGHEADSVVLPLRSEMALLLDHACAWRMLNLSSSNARHIDLLIATGFPAWCARHPRKVAWIAHEDPLAGADWTGGGANTDADAEDRLRRRLVELDARALAECRRVFVGGVATAARLKRWAGVEAGLLSAPPPAGDQRSAWDRIIEQLLG